MHDMLTMKCAGVVVTPTDKKLNPSEQRGDGTLNGQQNGCEEDEDDEDDEPPATILEPQGTFSNLMVWDHERLPAAEDSFVKGINEWIRFAEAVGFGGYLLLRSTVLQVRANCCVW